MEPTIRQLSAPELARALARPEPPLLLDVRELWERAIASIEPAISVPLSQLPHGLAGLAQNAEIAVYCHHGVRSLHACNFLAAQGYTQLVNLEGGIDAWSREVDATVPRY